MEVLIMPSVNVAPSSEVERLLLSKKESAHALSLSLRTIDNLLATKQLPCRKIGRRTLIPAAAVRKFARADR
jgi:excisionase family DNA binding protein